MWEGITIASIVLNVSSSNVNWGVPDMTPINDDWVSEDRLEPYMKRVCRDVCAARELYVLDRRLSSSLFMDISFLEVALRNSINRNFTERFGEDWYSRIEIGFDARVRENIQESWSRLPAHFTGKGAVKGSRLGGRLVATSMFRTWTNMLDKGGDSGLKEPFDRADHDRIWGRRDLVKVFPGAQRLARMQDPKFGNRGLTREWVYEKVFPVRQIRNRIAHHESVIPNGIPITGTDVRLGPQGCHEACMDLAAMLDEELAQFLTTLSTPKILTDVEIFLKKF